MDAIKILGSLLGGRSPQGGGLGRQVLEQFLGGGQQREQQQHAEAQRRQQQAARQAQQSQARAQSQARQQQYSQRGQSFDSVLRDARHRSQGHASQAPQASQGHDHHQHHGYDDSELNRRSAVLIRAMISAAKSDGSIDSAEQKQIVGKLGQISQDEAQFLNDEFRRPLQIHEFAHSVPAGMEEEVYAVSLMSIRLDTQAEANYLRELSECLRIDPRLRDEIHVHYHAPCLH